jgi:hypothetical protein
MRERAPIYELICARYVIQFLPDKEGVIGVAMLCPVGFHETLIYDCRGGKREVIYRDAYIPTKKRRGELRREGVTVSEAVKLARTAVQAEGRNILSARN